MPITFDLPPDIERSLKNDLGDLDRAAKEAALVELYRQRKISIRDLARAMDITRLECDEMLKKHNVVDDLPTDSDQNAALERLRSNP